MELGNICTLKDIATLPLFPASYQMPFQFNSGLTLATDSLLVGWRERFDETVSLIGR